MSPDKLLLAIALKLRATAGAIAGDFWDWQYLGNAP
jgi:hypothetical protein